MPSQPDDLAEARAIGNVVFTGHRDDVEDLYPGFDMYVLPSYREGFPRSAMEAAASGLPVIATDIRGCRQVVDHDVDGTAGTRPQRAGAGAGRRRAGRPTAPRRLGDGPRGRRKAEAEFDDRTVIERTLAAYRTLPEPTSSWTTDRMAPSAAASR